MIKATLIYIIRLYQKFISPLFVKSCRFYPSCSEYTIQALHQHGVRTGGVLSLKRLAKCHPWHPGGVDEIGVST